MTRGMALDGLWFLGGIALGVWVVWIAWTL